MEHLPIILQTLIPMYMFYCFCFVFIIVFTQCLGIVQINLTAYYIVIITEKQPIVKAMIFIACRSPY